MKKLFLILSLIFIANCSVNIDGINAGNGLQIVPDPPSNISISSSNGMITLTWSSVQNADSYNVYYSPSQGIHDVRVQNVSSPFNHIVTNDSKIYYVVTSVNSAGESADSAEVSATAGLIDNKNGSITIIKDGLTWAKCSQTNAYGGNAYEFTKNDCSFGLPAMLNYCATDYACDDTIKLVGGPSEAYNSCYFMALNGGGWRVPNADEMLLMHNSYIKEPQLWPGLLNDNYWSTNAYGSNWNTYILINMVSGNYQTPPGNAQAFRTYVLCVK